MITVCMTYFRSLTLDNLKAALHCLRQQDFSGVKEILLLCNNVDDSDEEVWSIIDAIEWPVPFRLFHCKHSDASRTHAWSTNAVVQYAQTDWIFFTRADYLLDFNALTHFSSARGNDNQFIVAGYYDVQIDILTCERFPWKEQGPQVLQSFGREYDHVTIDSGVWMTRKSIFDKVGGLDERLTAWGHAQTHFQHKLFLAGVEFVRIPYVLFYHPTHGYETPRDHATAKQQLKDATGLTVPEMWQRYTGPDNPYVGQ